MELSTAWKEGEKLRVRKETRACKRNRMNIKVNDGVGGVGRRVPCVDPRSIGPNSAEQATFELIGLFCGEPLIKNPQELKRKKEVGWMDRNVGGKKIRRREMYRYGDANLSGGISDRWWTLLISLWLSRASFN
jgi:hypothetical protein